MTILRNLTENAIKSTDAKRNAAIAWRAWQGDGQHFLPITDNGIGATEEKFRALYDDSVASRTRSGLGLHLIRDPAKAINCKIWFETAVGNGATFTWAFDDQKLAV